jgi:hypothetical protein
MLHSRLLAFTLLYSTLVFRAPTRDALLKQHPRSRLQLGTRPFRDPRSMASAALRAAGCKRHPWCAHSATVRSVPGQRRVQVHRRAQSAAGRSPTPPRVHCAASLQLLHDLATVHSSRGTAVVADCNSSCCALSPLNSTLHCFARSGMSYVCCSSWATPHPGTPLPRAAGHQCRHVLPAPAEHSMLQGCAAPAERSTLQGCVLWCVFSASPCCGTHLLACQRLHLPRPALRLSQPSSCAASHRALPSSVTGTTS